MPKGEAEKRMTVDVAMAHSPTPVPTATELVKAPTRRVVVDVRTMQSATAVDVKMAKPQPVPVPQSQPKQIDTKPSPSMASLQTQVPPANDAQNITEYKPVAIPLQKNTIPPKPQAMQVLSSLLHKPINPADSLSAVRPLTSVGLKPTVESSVHTVPVVRNKFVGI